jgi:hypothetical protein
MDLQSHLPKREDLRRNGLDRDVPLYRLPRTVRDWMPFASATLICALAYSTSTN